MKSRTTGRRGLGLGPGLAAGGLRLAPALRRLSQQAQTQAAELQAGQLPGTSTGAVGGVRGGS